MTSLRAGARSALLICLAGAFFGGGAAAANDGKAAYEANCQVCHGVSGVGVPGFAPPLARPDWWAALGDNASAYLAGVIVAGLVGRIEAGGAPYIGLRMPPLGRLSDEDILAVAQYVMTDMNGLDEALTPEALATVRTAPPEHAALILMRPEAE